MCSAQKKMFLLSPLCSAQKKMFLLSPLATYDVFYIKYLEKFYLIFFILSFLAKISCVLQEKNL